MTEVSQLPPGVYVLAVSGGVDSIVLLDMLAKQTKLHLIVAHIDHGIRSDSHEDALFVEHVAKSYGFPYEVTRLHLSAEASEEQARHERYKFLESIQQKYNARAIITAHHADDVVETVIINLLRGTGWRGLCSLRSEGNIVRPMLGLYKEDIIKYAQQNHLGWREDSTNQQTNYLRNYVRLQLLPSLLKKQPEAKTKLYTLWQWQCKLRRVIESEVEKLYLSMSDKTGLKRSLFKQCEPIVADEILRLFLANYDVRQTLPQRSRILQFIQTAAHSKKFSLNRNAFLQLTRDHVIVVPIKN